MEKHEIRLTYQQATQLAQVGRYEEALALLVELDRAKPNTEGILYLIAACHANAGHKKEALEICERLILEFDNQGALKIRQHLTRSASPLGRARKDVPKTNAAKGAAAPPVPAAGKTEKAPQPKPEQEQAPAVEAEREPITDEPAPSDPDHIEEAADIETPHIGEIPIVQRKEDDDMETPPLQEVPAAATKPTNGARDVAADMPAGEKKLRVPMWLTLLIASVLAGLAAALLHHFVLAPWFLL